MYRSSGRFYWVLLYTKSARNTDMSVSSYALSWDLVFALDNRATVVQCSRDCGAMFARLWCNVRATVVQCSRNCGAMFARLWCNVRVTVVQCSRDCGAMFARLSCSDRATVIHGYATACLATSSRDCRDRTRWSWSRDYIRRTTVLIALYRRNCALVVIAWL